MVLTAEFRLSILLLVGINCLMLADTAWQNDWDKPHHYECPERQYFSGVESIHSNSKEDRRWEFRCRVLPFGAYLGTCQWHYDVNQMDQLLAFQCDDNQVTTAVYSYHDNGPEDRVFSFRCCNLVGKTLEQCELTAFINSYDNLMDYDAPPDYAIIGFLSNHHNGKEDREWKLDICHIK